MFVTIALAFTQGLGQLRVGILLEVTSRIAGWNRGAVILK